MLATAREGTRRHRDGLGFRRVEQRRSRSLSGIRASRGTGRGGRPVGADPLRDSRQRFAEEEKPYREWLIPAALINARMSVRLLDEEEIEGDNGGLK